MNIRRGARKLAWLGALAVSSVWAMGTASGGTYSWVPTGSSTYNWNSTANWTPNTNFPNNVGDVAQSLNDVGNQTINLNASSITIGALTIGNAADWNRTIITTNAPGQVLILNNGGSPARITQNNVNSANACLIRAPVQLPGGLVVTNHASTEKPVVLQGALSGANTDIAIGKNAFQWAPTANTTYANKITTSASGLFSKGGAWDLRLTANNKFRMQAENGGNPGDGGIRGGGRLIVDGCILTNSATGLSGYGNILYLFGNPNNTLVITNGGRYVRGGGTPLIGANATGTNTVVVTGNGSTFDGAGGADWRMLSYSRLTVADEGVVTNVGTLNSFLSYNDFRIVVTNGGRLYANLLWVGGDRATVKIGGTNAATGNPAKLTTSGALYVGSAAGDDTNSVIVGAGCILKMGSVRVARDAGTGNRLVVTNGGLASIAGTSYMNGTNNTIWVGGLNPATGARSTFDLGASSLIMPDSAGARNNSLIVDAGGTVTNGTLYTGGQYNGARQQYVTVRNGGRIYVNGSVGNTASASQNTISNGVTVTGAGSIWNNKGNGFHVLYMSSGGAYTGKFNFARIEAGGVLTNCSILVGTTPGFQSGATSRENWLIVTNGGRISCMGASAIGNGETWSPSTAACLSNTATVVGGTYGDSVWNQGNQNLTVGYARYGGVRVQGNELRVRTGGIVTNVATFTVGSGAGATNNWATISGGTVSATTLSIGGTNNRLVFEKGLLRLRDASVNNGLPFRVGNGTDAAEYRMSGTTNNAHTFANGLTVAANASLTGSGKIASATTIDGNLAPGAGTSTSNIQFAATATLTGTAQI